MAATIINLGFLATEYTKRISPKDTPFLSKWTKETSFTCIIFGLIYTSISILARWHNFCFVGKPIQIISLTSQAIFMGFNQISRLYYCFSRNSVYNKAGYPDWLFKLMIMIGIIYLLMASIYPWFWISELCGGGYENKYEYIAPPTRHAPGLESWINFGVILYLLWDFTTLMLYIIKVFSFRKYKQTQNKQIYNRVQFILKKVVILTVLYEIPALCCYTMGEILDEVAHANENDEAFVVVLFGTLYRSSWIVASIFGNLSIFLMQSHNDEEYKQFLMILYRFKIYYVCCGCRKVFDTVLDEIEEDKTKLELEAMTSKTGTTVYETKDISVKHQHSEYKGYDDASVLTTAL